MSYEPNDTPAQATPINLGRIYQSYLERPDDVDYYRVRVDVTPGAARQLVVRVFNVALDADVSVIDPTGARLGAGRLRGGPSATVRVSAVIAGDYLVQIQAVGQSSTIPYSLITSLQ